jgi:hypothetical protein
LYDEVLQKFVLSYVNVPISITTTFDLWMNKDTLYFWFFDLFKIFALMLDLKFKDVSILNNYVQIGKITIAAIRYDLKILIPLLCSIYQKVHPFVKHASNFSFEEWPLVVFDIKLI